MDIQWLEMIMKKIEAESRASKITSMSCEQAVPKGENYSSNMLRVRMDLILGSGRTTKKNLVIKKKLTGVKNSHLSNSLFSLESMMYEVFFPKYTELLKGTQLVGNTLWPRSYYASNEEIVMEDLKESGYRVVNRKVGVDLEHAKVAMRSYAMLHCLSHICINKGLVDPSAIKKFAFCDDSDVSIQVFLGSSIKALIKSIKDHWSPDWAQTADKITSISDVITTKLSNLERETTGLKVINQGDSWCTNMMFKYNSFGKPYCLKFLDFQLSHFNSFGWDLNYFLYTSLLPEVRDPNMDLLLKEYADSYHYVLKELDQDTTSAPSFNQVKTEVKRLHLFGFVAAASIAPIVLNINTDILNFDEVLKDENKKMIYYINPTYVSYMKKTLTYFIENGVI